MTSNSVSQRTLCKYPPKQSLINGYQTETIGWNNTPKFYQGAERGNAEIIPERLRKWHWR